MPIRLKDSIFGEKIMKNKRIITTALCTLIAASGILGACQKTESSRGIYEPEEETKPTPTQQAQLPDPTPTEAEATPTPVPVSKDIPALAISKRYSDFDNDNRGYELSFNYELLHTERAYGNAHPGLRDSMEEVNSFVEEVVGDGCSGYAEIISGMSDDELEHARNMGEYPKYSFNKAYTSRADEKIVSYIYENRSYDLNDEYDYVSVRGYNFYVEDGTPVELSDIVADEDALYDLMAEKLSVRVHDELEAMMDYPVDPAKTRQEILDYISMYNASWVLTPQGISYYFDTFTFMPWVTGVTILFSKDTKGEIFTDEFRNEGCDEWIMKLPQYCQIEFDAEDDGKSDIIRVYDMTDFAAEFDYGADPVIGVNIYLNGDISAFTEGEQPYDNEAYLLHKDGKSYVLVYYSEYDYNFFDTYELRGTKAYHVDSFDGWIEGIPESDYIWGYEYNQPQRIITGYYGIPVCVLLNVETWEIKRGIMDIGPGAKLNITWE